MFGLVEHVVLQICKTGILLFYEQNRIFINYVVWENIALVRSVLGYVIQYGNRKFYEIATNKTSNTFQNWISWT